MTTPFDKNIFNTFYKDDYSDSDNYYKIVFNAGRFLQARELTQMQTIIQKEIERFGRNIFKEGAAVVPGGPSITNNLEFIKLNTTTNGLPSDPTTLIGATYRGQTSLIEFKIIDVVVAEGSDPATLYVQYTDTSNGTAGTSPVRITPGENIVDVLSALATLTVQTTNTSGNPAYGQGTRFNSGAGSFFAQGHFVFAPAQKIYLSKYSSSFTGEVGFIIVEDIVTETDNSALYDNQGDVPNVAAPGAHRYRIRLTLSKKSDAAATDNFVFFANIIDSNIVEEVTGKENYAVINDFMALRTKEESGNYLVKPFKIKYEDHDTNTSQLYLNVSDGIAYVNGYRAYRPASTKFTVDKPTSTTTFNNSVVSAAYGNYVLVTNGLGIPDINTLELVNLRDTVAYGGSTIGTARVRGMEEYDTNQWKVYLFDITMTAGQSFRNIKSLGTSVTNYLDLVLENSLAVLKEPENNNLLFELPNARPQTISDIVLTVQRRLTGVASGNQITITTAADEAFTNTSTWIVGDDSSGILSGFTVSLGGDPTSATISGAADVIKNGQTIEVLAQVQKSAGQIRTKTLTETTETLATDSDGVTLSNADIYEVTRITLADSDGASLSNRYTIDNGQRDNYYGLGRLVLKGGFSNPGGNVFIRYKYFSHGNGDFFAVNSYTGQVEYANIPSHRMNNGSTINLRDILDFRPVQNSSTTYSGGNAVVNELPPNTGLITSDVTYYLPRNDIVALDENGDISVVKGVASLTPSFPTIGSDKLALYKVKMGPNTLNARDVMTTFVDAKRYTMSDIAKLESKLNKVEEIATLSLLELATANLSVLDDSGFDRTKAGFLVDNFANQYFSATYLDDYRASIDPQRQQMRPKFVEKNIRVLYDSDLSTNTILKGDNVYLKYDETEYITQPQMSTTENINPFGVVSDRGTITLSPASDEWRDVEFDADRVVDNNDELDTQLALLWNNWEWNWGGVDLNNLQQNAFENVQNAMNRPGRRIRTNGQLVENRRWSFGTVDTGTTTSTGTTVNRVTSESTIREVIGDRVIDVALVPFIRSRKVYFKAQGLRPNTRFFAFFDGVAVANWVREETFQQFAATTEDTGNLNTTASAHPDGATNLISNSKGEIEGTFYIPNTDTLRFRTGARVFKLIDVSADVAANITSIAESVYTAQGTIETRQRTVTSTRQNEVVDTQTVTQRNRVIGPRMRQDPLAQSFFISEDTGAFVTKVRVYFASKADTVPVQLQLRPMVNGYPSSNEVIPGSTVFLDPASVTLPASATETDILAGGTDFVFPEPIYLNPFTEYCVVLLANTTEYTVYISNQGDFIIGSTEKRITSQPSMGSLFKSQNSATWTAVQEQDLAFALYRADFDTAGGAIVTENAAVPRVQLGTDPLQLDSGNDRIFVSYPNHGFDSGDTIDIYGLDSGTVYGGILGSSILGSRTIFKSDWTGVQIIADSAATSSVDIGGTSIEATQNMMFNTVFPYYEALVPQSTTITLQGKFTTGSSFTTNLASDPRYNKDASYRALGIRVNNNLTSPHMIANQSLEATQLGAGVKSATMNIPLTTSNSYVSPVIDMQRASLTLINNIIDKQDSAATDGFNIPINFVNETSSTGGSQAAKHITIPVTLADQAVGLKIILTANRPSVSDFLVYYRTVQEGSNIDDTAWTLVEKETDVTSDENPAIFREYRYLAGGNSGTLTPFTQYQLKIVMTSTNSSKVPVIKDLRVIAMVD